MEAAGESQARERGLHAEFCAFLNSDRSELGLSPDEVVNQRGKRYVELHTRLARLFAWRGCHDPERLADKALDRAKQKWAQHRETGRLAPNDIPNPVGFVCSFVRFIYLEWLAEQHKPELPVLEERSAEEELALDCLDRCLDSILESEDRKLICEYHKANIDQRKAIAGRLNVSVNALRLKCYRIRRLLRTCVLNCIARKRPEMNWQNSTFSSEDRS